MKKFKYILLVLFILLIGLINVNAQTPTTRNREELDNLGVNKKWNINENNRSNVLRTKLVDSEEKIYDFSNVMTDEEIEKLKQKSIEFKNKTNMEIIILTDSLVYSSDKQNEDYAADFYDYNDFGLDLDKNYSGVLLFRNTYEEDPYYNIYTFGEAQLYFDYYRLESVLDDIYNDLHSGNYYEVFNNYISKMDSYYDSGKSSEMEGYTIDENGYLQAPPKKYHPPIILALGISSIITLIIILILIKKNKMIMKETRADQYIDMKSVKISNRQDVFITSHTTQHTISSDSGSSGGGSFHSSSGSSGGGHSSGGVRHG